ncbi:MAG: hypothetical protein WBG32_23455, partial [Nodosilinea sp.]
IYVLRKARGKLMRWIQKHYHFSYTYIESPSTPASLVNGYFRDNWLSPVVTILSKKAGASEEFYVVGTAPINLVMTVYSGKQMVSSFNISAHQNQTIKLSSSVLSDKSLKLSFSKYIKDSSGRKISFLLEATNLFSERDLG